MAPPLYDEAVEYTDGTPMTLEQHAHDVAAFLNWTAQPELEARKALGIKVLLFLIVLTAMMYAVKRKIWRDVEH
jgi:cytochrome c1